MVEIETNILKEEIKRRISKDKVTIEEIFKIIENIEQKEYSRRVKEYAEYLKCKLEFIETNKFMSIQTERKLISEMENLLNSTLADLEDEDILNISLRFEKHKNKLRKWGFEV